MSYYVPIAHAGKKGRTNHKARPSPAADRLISEQPGDVGKTKHTRSCLKATASTVNSKAYNITKLQNIDLIYL